MLDKLRARLQNWMHPSDEYKPDVLFNELYGRKEILTPVSELESISGVQIASRPVQVALIRITDDDCMPEKLNKVMESCRDFSDSDEVLPTNDGCNHVALLFFQDTIWNDQIIELLDDIRKDYSEKYPSSHLYITLGPVEEYSDSGMPSWRRSYIKAAGLQDYRYIKTKGSIIAYSDIKSRRKEIYPEGMDFRYDLLREYLEADDSVHLNEWLTRAYAALSGSDNPGLVYHLTLEIVVNAVSYLRERGLFSEKIVGYPEDIVNSVLDLQSPEELRLWSTEFLLRCRDIFRKAV